MKRIIESAKFEDAQLRKAYSDYMYTRDMMDGEAEAGLDELARTALIYLRQHGKLDKVGLHGEDRYAVKINVRVGSENEPWLLMINTDAGENCLTGSVCDALSGRTYPYAAMRISGSGDPLEMTKGLVPSDGKLSQREITSAAAKSYADQAAGLGIATGIASEIYHPNFADERMDVAAVLSAAPAVNMRGEEPAEGDEWNILGTEDGAEADASYLRRVRKLMSDGEAARMIKVAAKDDNGAIRCLVAPENTEMFEIAAKAEGFECKAFEADEPEAELETEIKEETEAEEVRKEYEIEKAGNWQESYLADDKLSFSDSMKKIAEDLNTCSGRGLTERFDSTIGAGAVMMPLGGINQLTPMQAMAYKLPAQHAETDDCTVAAWGYNPYITEASPYHGGYLAVVESISKLVATGASFNEVYLAIQTNDNLAGLLGAFEAEMGLSAPAISFGDLKAEMPALISMAFTTAGASELVSPDFKEAGHRVVMLKPEIEADSASAYYGLPTPASLVALWRKAYELIANGRALAASTPTMGGVAESIMKMSYGNGIGFEFSDEGFDWSDSKSNNSIFGYSYGSIILEMADNDDIKSRSVDIVELGYTTDEHIIKKGEESVGIGELLMLYEGKLESVFGTNADSGLGEIANLGYAARSWHTPIFKRQQPKALIPVVAGCTSEEDLARAVGAAGAAVELLRLDAGSEDDVRRSAQMVAEALKRSQILMLPSGFAVSSDAEDPASLMAAVLREEGAAEALDELINKKDGLVLGIGSGFKALLELRLLPEGELIINTLGAHQSRIARVRIASNKSPWLRSSKAGDIRSIPISNEAGRFIASDEVIKKLAINGQIATQYVDNTGAATADIRFNPSGSAMAIEGISSEDGRVLGRMGHVERTAAGLYKNVPGNYISAMFENAVRYFK